MPSAPGVGEHVFFVRGNEASFPFLPAEPPVDACVVGIVDHWDHRLRTRCRSAASSARVVATQKHRKLDGAKLLLVQPLALDDSPRGVPLLTIDSVGAGVGEKVLIVIEGRAAGEALRRSGGPGGRGDHRHRRSRGTGDGVSQRDMNEVDVRALVREAVARHFGPQAQRSPAGPPRATASLPSSPSPQAMHGGQSWPGTAATRCT